jgi:hypothetical protein
MRTENKELKMENGKRRLKFEIKAIGTKVDCTEASNEDDITLKTTSNKIKVIYHLPYCAQI